MRGSAARPVGAAALWRALCRCRRGLIAVQTAILLVVLLGFVSLAVDIGAMQSQRRAMQSAADSASLGAALAATLGNPPNLSVEAKSIAASYGFVDGTANTTVAVNNPPTLGAYAKNASGVEVLITRPYSAILASLFHPTAFSIAARAVALIGQPGNTCVLALNSAASGAFTASGSAAVTLNACDLAIQSASSSALLVTGGAVVDAEDVSIVGGYETQGSGAINSTNGIQTGAPAAVDPYSTLAVPAYSGCGQSNFSVGGTTVETLSPGVYCNGLSIGASAHVTLNPGQYILNGGNFSVSGAATVTGSGVTIILTSSKGASTIGNVSIGASGVLSLSAMLTGTTAGVVFYQDQTAPTSGSNTFDGAATMQITGAIYLPRQSVTYAGSANNTSGCTQIIALTVDFQGGAAFALDCSGIPIRAIGTIIQPTLVE